MTWPHGRVKGQLAETDAVDSGFPAKLLPCTEKRAFHLSATWLHGSGCTSFNQTRWTEHDKCFKQMLGADHNKQRTVGPNFRETRRVLQPEVDPICERLPGPTGKAGQRGEHKQVVLKSAGCFSWATGATKAEKQIARQLRPSQHQGWVLVGVTPLSRGVALGPHPDSCTVETRLPHRMAGSPSAASWSRSSPRPRSCTS